MIGLQQLHPKTVDEVDGFRAAHRLALHELGSLRRPGWHYWLPKGPGDGDLGMSLFSFHRPVPETPGSRYTGRLAMSDLQSPRAQCWYHFGDHPAPAEGCTCGWHVTARLDVLTAYFVKKGLGGPVEHTPVAFGQVRAVGRVERSDPVNDDDPPGTVRAERLELLGPIYAAPAAGMLDVDRISKLGVEVVPAPRGVAFFDWINLVIAAEGARP